MSSCFVSSRLVEPLAGQGLDTTGRPPHRPPHVPLLDVQQGADLGDPAAVQVGHGLEAADPPLQEEAHEHGLHRVVVVVAQGDLVQAQPVQLCAQGAPAQLGAQGAGIFLLPVDKDDLVDWYADQVVGHLQILAQPGNGGEIHSRRAAVDGDGRHLEPLGIEAAQPGQGGQGEHGVLAAAYAHGHRVAAFDHMVVLHAPADQR